MLEEKQNSVVSEKAKDKRVLQKNWTKHEM